MLQRLPCVHNYHVTLCCRDFRVSGLTVHDCHNVPPCCWHSRVSGLVVHYCHNVPLCCSDLWVSYLADPDCHNVPLCCWNFRVSGLVDQKYRISFFSLVVKHFFEVGRKARASWHFYYIFLFFFLSFLFHLFLPFPRERKFLSHFLDFPLVGVFLGEREKMWISVRIFIDVDNKINFLFFLLFLRCWKKKISKDK